MNTEIKFIESASSYFASLRVSGSLRDLFYRHLLVLVALMGPSAAALIADEPPAVHSLTLAEKTVFSPIDLGVLPVDVAAHFTFDLTHAGSEKAVLEVESNCSCLEVSLAPKVLNQDTNRIGFTFTPNGAGPAEINLQFLTLDLSDDETRTYTLPVKIVGFDPPSGDNASVLDTLKQLNPSDAFQQLGAYRVIDARGVDAYEKARVPGSFEYNLDLLLAKEDLLSGKVLLVGEPVLKQREIDLLEQLAAKAPDLAWLKGGMSAWMRQGLPVEGVWPSSAHTSMISLNRWLESGPSEEQWQVVDLSGEVLEGERFFGHLVLRPESNQPQAIRRVVLQAMEAALRKPEGKAVLVIGDARELVYPLAEVVARGDQPIQVFYLKKGALTYQNWKRASYGSDRHGFQTISITSSSSRLPAPGSPHSNLSRPKGGCGSCPGR